MKHRIFIAPLHFSNPQLLQNIKKELEHVLPGEVLFIDLPLDVDAVHSKERNQYYSTKLIAQALKVTDPHDGKVLILVEFDLYVPVFTFLFGEAQLNGKHSIVSLCRLHEEFYTGKSDNRLLMQRAMKEILHELGHNFGLHHCDNWDCVMHVSSGIEEVDLKGEYYCKSCEKAVRNG